MDGFARTRSAASAASHLAAKDRASTSTPVLRAEVRTAFTALRPTREGGCTGERLGACPLLIAARARGARMGAGRVRVCGCPPPGGIVSSEAASPHLFEQPRRILHALVPDAVGLKLTRGQVRQDVAELVQLSPRQGADVEVRGVR